MVQNQTPGRRPAGMEPVDLNNATWEELRSVNGIGERRADEILNWRTAKGPFKTVDDLQNVPLFDAKILNDVRDRLKV